MPAERQPQRTGHRQSPALQRALRYTEQPGDLDLSEEPQCRFSRVVHAEQVRTLTDESRYHLRPRAGGCRVLQPNPFPGDTGAEVSLKERVVKFLHSQSHREEPRPSAALDFPSIKAEPVAALIFIHKADEAHFTDMCAAVEIDPASLIQSLTAHPST